MPTAFFFLAYGFFSSFNDLVDLVPWACSRMLAALPGYKV